MIEYGKAGDTILAFGQVEVKWPMEITKKTPRLKFILKVDYRLHFKSLFVKMPTMTGGAVGFKRTRLFDTTEPSSPLHPSREAGIITKLSRNHAKLAEDRARLARENDGLATLASHNRELNVHVNNATLRGDFERKDGGRRTINFYANIKMTSLGKVQRIDR